MKRVITVILSFVMLLSLASCSTSSEPAASEIHVQPTEAQLEVSAPPTEDRQETETTDDADSKVTVGNITFSIPDGFSILSETESSYALISSDDDCGIGIYALDISAISEEQVKSFLPLQHDSFLSDDEIRYEESDIEYNVACFPVIIDAYADISSLSVKMNTTFTDSWYSYTITYTCNSDSDKVGEYATAFAKFIINAEYSGAERRFDYVQ